MVDLPYCWHVVFGKVVWWWAAVGAGHKESFQHELQHHQFTLHSFCQAPTDIGGSWYGWNGEKV